MHKYYIIALIICFIVSCSEPVLKDDKLTFEIDNNKREFSGNMDAGINNVNGIVLYGGTNKENLTIILGNPKKGTWTEDDLAPLPPDSLKNEDDSAMFYEFAENNYFFYKDDSVHYTTVVSYATCSVMITRYTYENTGKLELEGAFSGKLYPMDTTQNDSTPITISDGIFYYSNFN